MKNEETLGDLLFMENFYKAHELLCNWQHNIQEVFQDKLVKGKLSLVFIRRKLWLQYGNLNACFVLIIRI